MAALAPNFGTSPVFSLRRTQCSFHSQKNTVISDKNPSDARSLPFAFQGTVQKSGGWSVLKNAAVLEPSVSYGITENESDVGYEPSCIIQAFSWSSGESSHAQQTWYATVIKNVQELRDLGFSDILLPPCAKSADKQGFLPSEFYDLNSFYGSESELKQLIQEIHKHGMKACCDIVINHLAGKQPEGHVAWKPAGGTVDEEIDWGKWAAAAGSESAMGPQASSLFEYGSVPAIDHSNPMVQSDAKGWLNWLRKDIGFDAWCYDLAKMFDPSVVHMYNKVSGPLYSIGDVWNPMRYNGMALEYNQDQHRQELVNWVKLTRGSSMALDYTTKGILQQAVEKREYWRLIDPSGKPPGMIGWLPTKAITFIDNHTTGSIPKQWPFPNWGVMLGYCYILTHPGTPLVFWDHVFEWEHGAAISALVKCRQRNNICSSSEVKILACHPDLYVAKIGEGVDNKDFRGLVVKMGPTFDMRGIQPGSNWILNVSGTDFCVWEVQAPSG